jgi:hypothetical protein
MPKREELKDRVESTSTKTDVSNGRVYFEKGVTKALGDYGFAKVKIGVELPINHTPAMLREASKTIDALDKLVTVSMDEQLEVIGE